MLVKFWYHIYVPSRQSSYNSPLSMSFNSEQLHTSKPAAPYTSHRNPAIFNANDIHKTLIDYSTYLHNSLELHYKSIHKFNGHQFKFK